MSISELFQRGGQQAKKGKSMSKASSSVRKQLIALAAKPERNIDLSDIPSASAKQWKGHVCGKFYRPVK